MDIRIFRQKCAYYPHVDDPRTDQMLSGQGQSFTARMPSKGSDEAAGYDLSAYLPMPPYRIELAPLLVTRVPTGIYIEQPPLGVCLACCRSGLASKGVHIVNAPGIIDSDYRGELQVLLTYIAPPDHEPFVIRHGERIAQLLFIPPGKVDMGVNFIDVESVELLRTTSRGDKGFGSTGR